MERQKGNLVTFAEFNRRRVSKERGKPGDIVSIRYDARELVAEAWITAKLNDVDTQAWLADVLARIATHPNSRIDELLPWNWRHARAAPNAQAA